MEAKRTCWICNILYCMNEIQIIHDKLYCNSCIIYNKIEYKDIIVYTTNIEDVYLSE